MVSVSSHPPSGVQLAAPVVCPVPEAAVTFYVRLTMGVTTPETCRENLQ